MMTNLRKCLDVFFVLALLFQSFSVRADQDLLKQLDKLVEEAVAVADGPQEDIRILERDYLEFGNNIAERKLKIIETSEDPNTINMYIAFYNGNHQAYAKYIIHSRPIQYKADFFPAQKKNNDAKTVFDQYFELLEWSASK